MKGTNFFIWLSLEKILFVEKCTNRPVKAKIRLLGSEGQNKVWIIMKNARITT